MAIKPVTLKKKNGDVLHFKTSMAQVEGLNSAMSGKQNSLDAGQLAAVNSGATSELITKIGANETTIGVIEGKIPAQAGTENQLADKEFVNSTVNAMAANFVAFDASNANFPTKAALMSSNNWFRAGSAYIPKKNDYLVVLKDETQGDKQVRYLVTSNFKSGTAPTDSDIQLQYVINDAPFTAEQNAAIGSGITEAKVLAYDGVVSGMSNYLTTTAAGETYASKEEVEGLGTVYFVEHGASLDGFGDEDLIIEYDE